MDTIHIEDNSSQYKPHGGRAYHHGNLRAALIEQGLELAREGGVEALRLREVTRLVGVTPNAAYRHFAAQSKFVVAIARDVQSRMAAAMLDNTRAPAPDASLAEQAVERLRGVGLGYIGFAVSEPGWFELAFSTQDEPIKDSLGVTVTGLAPPPYQLLLDALDSMLDAGALTPDQRPNAEWACWSAVHGFANLATRGPLRSQHRETIDHLAVIVVETAIRGISA